jgi:hypothetical protein
LALEEPPFFILAKQLRSIEQHRFTRGDQMARHANALIGTGPSGVAEKMHPG